MIEALALCLVGAGALLLVLGAWGVLVLPNALSRQHAATKACTLALSLVGLGVALLAASPAWAWRLLLIVGFLMLTLPLGAHLLARATVREAGLDEQVRQAPRVARQAGRKGG
jgi:multicomponent Na+:H+ antiporter subunit G